VPIKSNKSEVPRKRMEIYNITIESAFEKELSYWN
jgi:hypothetical protein